MFTVKSILFFLTLKYNVIGKLNFYISYVTIRTQLFSLYILIVVIIFTLISAKNIDNNLFYCYHNIGSEVKILLTQNFMFDSQTPRYTWHCA